MSASNTEGILTGLASLERATREILGPAFDDEMQSLAEADGWLSPNLSASEIFTLRSLESIESLRDPIWIFQSIRTSERKYLSDHLGVPRTEIPGKSPTELACLLLKQAGIPIFKTSGLNKIRAGWREVIAEIQADQDEKAASMARQRAERFLKIVLYFHCATGRANEFSEIIKSPGSLRIPKPLLDAGSTLDAFQNDSWADLGFLAIALRKLSQACEQAKGDSTPLTLLTIQESEAFIELGSALQPYTHDKPSHATTRRTKLLQTAERIKATIDTMIARNIVPDECVVLETGIGLLGEVFRGIVDSGKEIRLRSSPPPPLGSRVLFVARSSRKHSAAEWTQNIWPAV